jgi:predicted metal-binding transcription factor (methanogenesis marker protein 9)
MESLTVGAAQQTVLRLLEGQETCNGELDCWCCTADSVTVIGGIGNM